jgi:hypothetical protein
MAAVSPISAPSARLAVEKMKKNQPPKRERGQDRFLLAIGREEQAGQPVLELSLLFSDMVGGETGGLSLPLCHRVCHGWQTHLLM